MPISQWFVNVLEEYGIKVNLVNEAYTSKTCSIYGEIHEKGRVHRGLYVCPKTGKAINASINIARKLGYEVKARQKIMSIQVTTNGTLNPHQRANNQDPQHRNPTP
jgi:putative transposase